MHVFFSDWHPAPMPESEFFIGPVPGRSQIELLALASKGKLGKEVLCSRVTKMNCIIITHSFAYHCCILAIQKDRGNSGRVP